MAKLNIEKPIVFFDLETTGTNISFDRIVEISYIKIWPNGKEEEKTYRINPTIPIPANASAVHGIFDKDVADKPTFKELANNIAEVFTNTDIAGFNSNRFDIPLLAEELLRAGINIDFTQHRFIDVQRIYHKKEPRTLSAAYQYYCHKNLDNAHSASADTRATYEILQAQIEKYSDLENDIDFLSNYSSEKIVDLSNRFTYNNENEIVFNFGKYKGQSVKTTCLRDRGYIEWLMQSDMPLQSKQVLYQLYQKANA
jgi:DNA polymerase-3 subunit epsilon